MLSVLRRLLPLALQWRAGLTEIPHRQDRLDVRGLLTCCVRAVRFVVFCGCFQGFLSPFPTDAKSLGANLVSCTVDVFQRTCVEMLPTPSKFHYTFNQRDVIRVLQVRIAAPPLARHRTCRFCCLLLGLECVVLAPGRHWGCCACVCALQGIMCTTPMKCTSSDAITRLWAHEVLRVFQDRLVTAEDHAWFTSMLSDTLTRSFRLTSPIEPVRHA